MPPKTKTQDTPVNTLIPPSVDLDHIPLADRDYRINQAQCDCDFLELYCWLEDKHADKIDEIGLWESNIPHYIFPLTFQAPEFTRRCQACYVLAQRAIIAPTSDILFTITAQSIHQMMLASTMENNTPFSLEALTQLYQKMDFTTRARILRSCCPRMPNDPKRILHILPPSSVIKPSKLYP